MNDSTSNNPASKLPNSEKVSALTDSSKIDKENIADSLHTTASEDNIDSKPDSNSTNQPKAANTSPSETANNSQIPPTDVSLICDEKLNPTKKATKRPYAKRSHQLLLVLCLIGVFLLAMVYQTLFGHLQRPNEDMIVEEGQSYYGLLAEFQRAIPMFSASVAKFYIKTSVDAPLNAGTYAMPENPSLMQMIEALQQEQKIDTVAVQIIEGKTANDLYQVLATTPGIELEVLQPDGKPKPNLKQALGIDAVTPDGEFADNLEGWFTPNTYHYAKGTSDKQILIDLYQNQQQYLDNAWANRAEGLPYESPYEALIMASIIEKETSVPSERGLVSAVFVNRLNQGMRLQTDPTIIYGIRERYDGDIRRGDIDEKTAYNTYQIDGLPPTPISLPAPPSIEAAMHPADSDALYFVATGNGGHAFTKTLTEHNRAVQAYLKTMREKNALEKASNQ